MLSPSDDIAKATVVERINRVTAFGATELSHGLALGLEQNALGREPSRANALVVLTDGDTFEDATDCQNWFKEAYKQNVLVYLVRVWNDISVVESTLQVKDNGVDLWLDEIEDSEQSLRQRLLDHYNAIQNYDVHIIPYQGIVLESAFRLSPPVRMFEGGGLSITGNRPSRGSIKVLLQFRLLPTESLSRVDVGRILVVGNGLSASGDVPVHEAFADMAVAVVAESTAQPPNDILDALGKLTLYRMQERAKEAASDPQYATRLQTQYLFMLSTNLQSPALPDDIAAHFRHLGEDDLIEALNVVERERLQREVSPLLQTGTLDGKQLKYRTRKLLSD